MDLSKTYDCIPYELLIAKLDLQGAAKNSLKLIHNYFSRRKQITNTSSSLSTWYVINTGVPKGSLLGPSLFNVIINNLFLFITRSHVFNFPESNALLVIIRICQRYFII